MTGRRTIRSARGSLATLLLAKTARAVPGAALEADCPATDETIAEIQAIDRHFSEQSRVALAFNTTPPWFRDRLALEHGIYCDEVAAAYR